MELFNFLEFKVIDIIDIVLVAIVLYYIYKLVKGTVAINIFIGIVIVYLIWKLTQVLQMKMISSLFGGFMSVGLIALIVVFQQEIRKFLLMIGSANIAKRKNFIKRFKFLRQDQFIAETDVDSILAACKKMSASRTGALIVIERSNPLDFVKNNGDPMNIEINQPIIESIFYKNSPLHDGAVIIDGNYIVATRVALPVSENRKIPARFGLRHKAAIGITERTDAIALVVSEETGTISYIRNGEFVLYKDLEDLSNIIQKDLV